MNITRILHPIRTYPRTGGTFLGIWKDDAYRLYFLPESHNNAKYMGQSWKTRRQLKAAVDVYDKYGTAVGSAK